MEKLVTDLDLSVRALTILRLLGVKTIDQLKSFTIEKYEGLLLGKDYFFRQGVSVSKRVVNEIKEMQSTL